MPIHLAQGLSIYLEVIAINMILSGDNVIVIGMAAAGLEAELRSRAVAAGVAAAAIIRIVFAVGTAKLLVLPGINFFGGCLLLWVCWTMLQELIASKQAPTGEAVAADRGKPLVLAIRQIIIADVSMSLDNVLAVAGAAKQNLGALVFGLILSVVLMGFASTFLAVLLKRHPWISWIGLAIITYVAVDMVWLGGWQLMILLG